MFYLNSYEQCDNSTLQDEEYLHEIYQKYVSLLNPNSGITSSIWETPQDISADDLVDFCAFNDLLYQKNANDEYESGNIYARAELVEVALLQYFNDISPEYLRTSRWYEYNEIPGRDNKNKYIMMMGGGGGLIKVLSAEKDGDILNIVVGLYVGDDTDNVEKAFMLSLKLEESGFKYLSYTEYLA